MWGTYRRKKAGDRVVWLSKININKQQIHGGTFDDQFEAHKRSVQLYEEMTGQKWKSEIEKHQNPDTLFDALEYNAETGILMWKSVVNRKRGDLAGQQAGYKHRSGYMQLEFLGKYYAAHRVCFYLYHGRWPKGQIDHLNGNREDNRICNLREVSKNENAQNQKEHRQGKFWGATHYKDKKTRPWLARVILKGKGYYAGYHETEYEAHIAAIELAAKHGIKVLPEYRSKS